MGMCPYCNGFKKLEAFCSVCGTDMEDSGKVSDYLDPYGHYNDEETVKLGDGFKNSSEDEICPHLLSCPSCGHDRVLFVKE
ncbi:hypothetical protein V1498_16900 [Peribacillus sp. SCS-26]|uniref:hypothetical protein n=1 Tax=Paraperibacillus marinus TaxID=3115295 RepID=UPI003905EB9E